MYYDEGPQMLDRWMQDEGTQAWLTVAKGYRNIDGGILCNLSLRDGRVGSCEIMNFDIPQDICGEPVPQRAVDASNWWQGATCRLLSGHDCPHMALTNVGAGGWVKKVSIVSRIKVVS